MHRLVRLLREMSPERRDALLKTLKSNRLTDLLRKVEKHAPETHEKGLVPNSYGSPADRTRARPT